MIPPEMLQRTRKVRVLYTLYRLGRPATVKEVCELLMDTYTPVYNTLNDLHIPEKNKGTALVERVDKAWGLTDSGRKEAEKLIV